MERFLYAKRNAEAEAIDDEDSVWPKEITTVDFTDPFTVVSPDKLSVKYTYGGVPNGGRIVQADIPAPTGSIYYFEIFVNNAGVQGRVETGFFKAVWLQTERREISYHGNDGFIYRRHGEEETRKALETYTTGEIIGCGIDYISQEFFFSKNGLLLGTIPKVFKGSLYPTVVLHSLNEEVTVNFERETFRFDLTGYETSMKEKKDMEIEMISIPPTITHELAKTYLFYYGYEDTLKALHFAAETEEQGTSLQERKNIRELIMMGDIDAAFEIMEQSYPQLLENDEVCFLLICQKIAELVRNRAGEEAVKFGAVELDKFSEDSAELVEISKDVHDLLVWNEDPEKSNVMYLLGEQQKEVVADVVIEAVLSSDPNNNSECSGLERFLRHLRASCHFCSL